MYDSYDSFVNDMRQIFINSFTFNNENSEIYDMTLKLKTYFEKTLQEIT